MNKSLRVAVVMGSKSDSDTMKNCTDVLDYFGISHEVFILSAHRTPDQTAKMAREAKENGFGVIIAAAGMAAHLPGVLAAYTTLPVIGVPLAASDLNGLDALYSIVQMPKGVPVATMAIGKAGAANAAILAAQILALQESEIARRLQSFKANECKIPVKA